MWLRRTDGVTGAAPEDGGETEAGDPPGGRGESAPGLPGTPETGFTPEPAAPSATGPGTPPKGLATASYACWAAASTTSFKAAVGTSSSAFATLLSVVLGSESLLSPGPVLSEAGPLPSLAP